MKRKTVALFMAALMSVSGITACPVMAKSSSSLTPGYEEIYSGRIEDVEEIGKFITTTPNDSSGGFSEFGTKPYTNSDDTTSGSLSKNTGSGSSIGTSSSHSESFGDGTSYSHSSGSSTSGGLSGNISSGSGSSIGTSSSHSESFGDGTSYSQGSGSSTNGGLGGNISSGSSSSIGTSSSHSESFGDGTSYSQDYSHSTGWGYSASSFSASSGKGTTVSVNISKGNAPTATISAISTKGSSASVAPSVRDSGGNVYPVETIASGSIKGKTYKRVDLVVGRNTRFRKNIVKGAKAKKTKTITVTCSDGQLKASSFDKKAFNGYRGKLIIRKKSITKKEFTKLKKNLKKGGFKGKISRK